MRLVIALVLAGVCSLAWAEPNAKPLYDFPATVDTSRLREQGATVRAVAAGDGYGLELTTQPNVEYPGVHIPAPGGGWNLSAYQGVEMVVTNTGKTPTSAVLRVDNAGDWQKNPWNGEAEHGIPAGKTRTLRVTFGKSWGRPGYALDSSKVVNLLIMGGKSDQPQTLVIRSLRPFGVAVKPETPIMVTYPAAVDFETDDLFNLLGGQITTGKAEVISGTRSLLGDSRGQDRPWFEFATTRLGMFAPGYRYIIRFKYRVLHAEPKAKFYALLRSKGQGWGQWDRAWTDMKDITSDPTTLREGIVTVGLDVLDDYQLMFGINGAARVALDDIQITQGKPYTEPDPVAEKVKAIPTSAGRIASFGFEQPQDALSVGAPGATTEDPTMVLDGKRSLLIDSLNSSREWNTSALLKAGTLEGGYRYYIHLKYRPITWTDDAFGYMFFKRTVPKVEQDTITSRQWRGTPGRNGVMYHRLEVPKDEMAYMELGIFKKGKMLVDDMVVLREPIGVKAIDTRVPLQRTDANLVWREEFDGKQLDPAKWTISHEPRRGGMWSKDRALLDGEGNLVLQFDKDKNGRYEMGALNTAGKFSFKYGYVEARMKLPKQVGHWPGVWLLNGSVNTVGNEGQDGTEVDIVECPWLNKDRASHALHWDGYGMDHQQVGQLAEVPGLHEGWHTYAVDWSEAGYIFFVDGKETWRSDAGGSCRNPLYIILSDEMGGWSGDPNQAKDLPDKTYIDYVRVWQEKPAK